MRLLALALLFATTVHAQEAPAPANTENRTISITSEALGDAGGGVATRLTFRYGAVLQAQTGGDFILQGSILKGAEVVRNFRYELRDAEREKLAFVAPLEPGQYTAEARLYAASFDGAPAVLAKSSQPFEVKSTGEPYVASSEDSVSGILAEGVVPEETGAVRIKPPRRDLAPNLFIVDVDVKPPVTRVEFYAEGKKIFTKNAPPYRAELDLGRLPRRVEVRAVGYDKAGRYIDADAWLVNERETPLEVKITRTVTADAVNHFKVSVQNNQNASLKSVELYANDKKLVAWDHPPYAFDVPASRLSGFDFVRATATTESNIEATDLLYLNGERYTETVDVNLVELPVSVTNATGSIVTNLKESDFQVLEDGKPQKLTSFAFANNLPLSVGVLVDHSGSMKPRIEDARKAALDFFKQIVGSKDRAFYGGFAFETSKLAPFVSEQSLLQSQVESTPGAEGGTALYDAIITGLYHFRGVEGRKALILVTDGEDTASRIYYNEMLTYARTARVPLYFLGIGISPLGGGSKMKALAAETGGVAYFVGKATELGEVYKKLETDLRSQYLLRYYAESKGKKDTAYRTVTVKTANPEYKVRTIRGYIP